LIAAMCARKSTAESVLRNEDQVELDDGCPDCRQVRRLFEIRRGLFGAPCQEELGLSKVDQRHLQDAVGVSFRIQQTLWLHGRERAGTMPRRQ
jgi:hypothetical protein